MSALLTFIAAAFGICAYAGVGVLMYMWADDVIEGYGSAYNNAHEKRESHRQNCIAVSLVWPVGFWVCLTNHLIRARSELRKVREKEAKEREELLKSEGIKP